MLTFSLPLKNEFTISKPSIDQMIPDCDAMDFQSLLHHFVGIQTSNQDDGDGQHPTGDSSTTDGFRAGECCSILRGCSGGRLSCHMLANSASLVA
jgi:hypothetical protein